MLDADAVLYCTCDLLLDVAYHCPGMNSRSIGIEMVQESNGDVWEAHRPYLRNCNVYEGDYHWAAHLWGGCPDWVWHKVTAARYPQASRGAAE